MSFLENNLASCVSQDLKNVCDVHLIRFKVRCTSCFGSDGNYCGPCQCTGFQEAHIELGNLCRILSDWFQAELRAHLPELTTQMLELVQQDPNLRAKWREALLVLDVIES